jgi:hypothetical protein
MAYASRLLNNAKNNYTPMKWEALEMVYTLHKFHHHHFVWAKQHYKLKTFSMGDYVLWFPKTNNSKLGKFKQQWFGPYHIQYCLPNNIALIVTMDKFYVNPILVNINKFKLYCMCDGDP